MNMKWKTTLCAVSLSALLLSGCAGQQSQMENVSFDSATSAALQAAGVTSDQASVNSVTLENKDGQEYYRVAFSVNGQQYQYDVDALTGKVLTDSNSSGSSDPSGSNSSSSSEAPLVTDADTFTSQPGVTNASSAGTSGTGNSGTMITAEEAQAKALAHAGLSETDVTFIGNKMDYDDGRQVYEVEFYTPDYKEYDYSVDVYTGEIVSYDFDAEYYTPPTSGSSSITEEEAKSLALAQVPGATAENIVKFKIDRDDGRTEYEGTIIYDGMEYEFEIDAYSGAFRSWESERYGW